MLPEVNDMKIKNKIIGKVAITCAASRYDKTPAEVRASIQRAIEAAWASEDQAAIQLKEKLFPQGKPTPEEFIAVMANHAKN